MGFLISYKSKVTSTFQNFYHIIKTKFNAKIATLRSDNGRKFQNHTYNEFLSSKGTVHQSSCAYTPQQNRVVERELSPSGSCLFTYVLYFPSFLSMRRCCSHCSSSHQPNAFPYHTPLNPLECLKEFYPTTYLISNVLLRVFGCTTYVHTYGSNQTKFTPSDSNLRVFWILSAPMRL